MSKFKVWDLEVCGNDIDGWEVDSWKQVDTLEIQDDISDDEIIELLVEQSHLTGYAHGRCTVDQQESWIYIYELQSSRPLFNLEQVG